MSNKNGSLAKKIMASIMIMSALGLGFSGAASACDLNSGGFIAQVVKCVAPPLAPIADAADQMNGQLGNPVDHTLAGVADGFVPGSGAALEAGWAIQRSGMLNMPAPGGQVNPPPQFQPAPMGGVCLTPTGFHPLGAPMPIGFTCSGVNQYGVYEVGTVR